MTDSTPTSAANPPLRAMQPGPAHLFEDLPWLKMFRAIALAGRPGRVLIGAITLGLVLLVGTLGQRGASELEPDQADTELRSLSEPQPGRENFARSIARSTHAGATEVAIGLVTLDPPRARLGVDLLLGLPARAWEVYGSRSIVLAIPILMIISIGGCAISRTAAFDLSRNKRVSSGEAVFFAARKAGALAIATFTPIVAVAAVALLLALAGWLLLGVDFFRPVAGVLFGPFLIAAFVSVVILVLTAVSFPLLAPAVACDGTDGFDALQRAFAYAIAHPIRLLLISLTTLAVGSFVLVFIGAAASAAIGFTHASMTALASPEFEHGAEAADPLYPRLARAWGAFFVTAVVGGYAVSFFYSASTVLYLILRRSTDGQDMADLWMPGLVEGTMAESLRARAEFARELELDAGRIQRRSTDPETGASS